MAQEPAAGQPADTYKGIADRHSGTAVEPWALLDQAHALSRSANRVDKEEALHLYRDVAKRWADQDLIRGLAEKSAESLERALSFRPPAPKAPPPDEEPAPEKNDSSEDPPPEAPKEKNP